VHGFRTLPADLGTLTKNRVRFRGWDTATMTVYTQPAAIQKRALDLLGAPADVQAAGDNANSRESLRASPGTCVAGGGTAV